MSKQEKLWLISDGLVKFVVNSTDARTIVDVCEIEGTSDDNTEDCISILLTCSFGLMPTEDAIARALARWVRTNNS